MSSWDHSSAADEHNSYTMRQGVNQPSPIESTYTDGCTYPDPTSFCTQTLPNYGDALPTSSHHYGPYFQTSGSQANEVQRDALPTSSHHYGPYFQTSGSRANEVQRDALPTSSHHYGPYFQTSGSQANEVQRDALPTSSHHYCPYFQTSDSQANEVQPDDPFAGDEYWSKQSWDADQLQYFADLDPFPEATQTSGIQGDFPSEGQLSTATMEQTREDIPHNSSLSPKAKLPMGTANTVASGSIYSAGNTGYARQNISYPRTYYPGSFLEEPPHSIHSVGRPLRYAPSHTSYPTDCPSYPLEERPHSLSSNPYSPGHALEQPSQTFSDCESPYASGPQSPSSSKKRKCSTRAQRPSHSKRPRTAYALQGENDATSVLGRKKAELGDSMGSDYRLREKTRVENGVLFGLVGNEWKPAGYHLDYRMRLILRDAQQPGAPVPPTFQQGIPPNYTSYSPITQGWNDNDLRSMTDSSGRHAFLMPAPPLDWEHNPSSGYLMCNGLVMLDQNNRPVKDYPGAPLTLSYDAPASLIEGLRRYFGMTYSDMTGRMPPQRHTRTGIKPVLGVTLLSTRVGRWYKSHKDRGLGPWHDRTKG